MYQQSSITAITDIPALVYAFAAGAGWTVTGTSSAPILTRPGGGLSFQLTASISGFDHMLSWAQSGGSEATSNARIYSPKVNGAFSTPNVSIPNKVHLFADTVPEAFLGIVIEYSFNSFRHLYLGNLVKASAFNGGEVISGATAKSGRDFFPYYFREAQFLFAAANGGSLIGSANSGGVYVNDAANPTKWRQFSRRADFSFPYSVDGSEALGGFTDDINDGYLARGRAAFAGVQPMVPMNLYAGVPVTGDSTFSPLGYPAGIRMVNMLDLEEAGEFTIGSQTWKYFPVFTKSAATSISQSSGGGWGAGETSYYVGYAYPKD